MDRLSTVVPVGDGAVLAILGDAIEDGTLGNVWALSSKLRTRLAESVSDVVPAYASVLVRFDPTRTKLAAVMACVRGALEEPLDATDRAPRRIEIGVDFHPDHALDLDMVARSLGMGVQAVQEAFCSATYRVAFLGFCAGFPYMTGLPDRLSIPRLATPRVRVPAGSVAIAAGQCGIYPRELPGGWRVLGKTGASMFDPHRRPPALLQPGDQVRFHAVHRLSQAKARIVA